MSAFPLIEQLHDESAERLAAARLDLAGRLKPVDDRRRSPRVCIYVTGSLARLEANLSSDLDAFFFLTGSEHNSALSRIRDIRILNAILETQCATGFPDFSNEGEYLHFLHINDVIKDIGGRGDDYHNALTARMLLMLESQYLYNERLFEKFRSQVVERYFVDFHKHNEAFRPIFLLNDVLRFWRTMCLNYEHGREWRNSDPEKRAKGHLANLKLRFSRLNICYSFVAKMLACGGNINQEQVIEIARITPLERLRRLGKSDSDAKVHVDVLLREYEWFLGVVGRPKAEVLAWISDRANRNGAFAHSDAFKSSMFALVDGIARKHNYQQFLVI